MRILQRRLLLLRLMRLLKLLRLQLPTEAATATTEYTLPAFTVNGVGTALGPTEGDYLKGWSSLIRKVQQNFTRQPRMVNPNQKRAKRLLASILIEQ